MKRKVLFVVAILLIFTLAIGLIACKDQQPEGEVLDQTPEEGGGSEGNGNGIETGDIQQPDEQPLYQGPSKEEVVVARSAAAAESVQTYDFTFNFSGTVFGVSATGLYEGKYRNNKNTGELKFERTTSGALLKDSSVCINQTGSNKIRYNLNKDKSLKSIKAGPQSADDIKMVNMPFVALVDAVKSTNINAVVKSEDPNYQYKTTLSLNPNHEKFAQVFDLFTSINAVADVASISITDIVNGLNLYFSITDGKMYNFSLKTNINIGIKGVPVTLTVAYSQRYNNQAIQMPSTAGFITKAADIATEVSAINTMISELKASPSYSIDLIAKNDFDPGFTKKSIVDRYRARMFKNTNEGRVDFNHSYRVQAHTDEAGKEKFRYTIGNITEAEGGVNVFLIDRTPATNKAYAKDSLTADTEFDMLFASVAINASEIDCIKKSTANGITTYKFFMTKEKTLSVQDTIADMIDNVTTDQEQYTVLGVNNYLSTDTNVLDAEYSIQVKDGKLIAIDVVTKLSYAPSGGEYTDRKITLNNNINMVVNSPDFASKLTDYKAPKSSGNFVGLGKASCDLLMGTSWD